jgi:hypothetical protein
MEEKYIFDPLMQSITDHAEPGAQAPYPPSRVIAGIDWAPASSIVRCALGGDN